MVSSAKICEMEAITLSEAVQSESLSPIEILEAILERMEKLEPILHAFCTPTPELARAEAKRVERDVRAGRKVGKLAGVPVGIKDLIFTKGIRTTGGSWVYRDFIPEEDDVSVERLKKADAIIIGKTNTCEFGFGTWGHNAIFETTCNPWDTNLTPGGSSAGSATAVAAGMGPIAIGSDGGGSIRQPASFCGIFGFKPSAGRIPLYASTLDERYPGFASWESSEVQGPLTRTVRDSALIMSVIAGNDDRDKRTISDCDIDWLGSVAGEIEGTKIAFSEDFGFAPVDPQVRAVARQAAEIFESKLGCIVEEANPPMDPNGYPSGAIIAFDSDIEGIRALVDKYGKQMSPDVVGFARYKWSAEQMSNAQKARKRLYNNMWKFMRQYDLILSPTIATPPYPVNYTAPQVIQGKFTDNGEGPFCMPFNATGWPAANLPAGFSTKGLPVGIQIGGGHLKDALVLRASAAFERVSPWKNQWPPLLKELGL